MKRRTTKFLALTLVAAGMALPQATFAGSGLGHGVVEWKYSFGGAGSNRVVGNNDLVDKPHRRYGINYTSLETSSPNTELYNYRGGNLQARIEGDIAAYDRSSSYFAGYDRDAQRLTLDFSGRAEASAAELRGDVTLFENSRYVSAEASAELDLLEYEVEGDFEASISTSGANLETEVAVGANLVEAEGEVQSNFSIPFTPITVTAKAGGSAAVGINAELETRARFSDGTLSLTFATKAAAGIGVGGGADVVVELW